MLSHVLHSSLTEPVADPVPGDFQLAGTGGSKSVANSFVRLQHKLLTAGIVQRRPDRPDAPPEFRALRGEQHPLRMTNVDELGDQSRMAIEDESAVLALRDPIRTKRLAVLRVELYIRRLLLVSLVGDDVAAAEEAGCLVILEHFVQQFADSCLVQDEDLFAAPQTRHVVEIRLDDAVDAWGEAIGRSDRLIDLNDLRGGCRRWRH
ncbi:uncharacterized protein N7458_007403 [Penicillium daleae]|uniref:Uncharacterized protein n=1 Tax=Penicillium daleae TaxID=63821 RepID=A0AAD6G144_9EURO|nr:uncharacterized protein N7458_007403 [Penicillium daleae]KAJ5443531.1 hypothetical protein N7458_007403 [Penicillium daleae]